MPSTPLTLDMPTIGVRSNLLSLGPSIDATVEVPPLGSAPTIE